MRISDWSSDVCSSDLLVISLWRRREAFGLDRRTAAWLAFESVACPPHAINLVRKLGLRQPLPGDAMSMATDALDAPALERLKATLRSEEHTSELQSLMRISYAVFCLKKKTQQQIQHTHHYIKQIHTEPHERHKYTRKT